MDIINFMDSMKYLLSFVLEFVLLTREEYIRFSADYQLPVSFLKVCALAGPTDTYTIGTPMLFSRESI